MVAESWDPDLLSQLSRRGHRLRLVEGFSRLMFGGGQIIRRDPATGVLVAGSDPRKDGSAVGF